jgi:amino-acid N-acetyltransferase
LLHTGLLWRIAMTIRELEPGEQGQARALLQSCDLPTADLPQASPHLFGAFDAKGLVGLVGVEAHGMVGLLRSLAVRADARGAGLGGCLADTAERWAAGRGIAVLYLLTTTAETFFAGRGYEVQPRDQVDPVIRQTTEFTAACPASATVMYRRLAHHATVS